MQITKRTILAALLISTALLSVAVVEVEAGQCIVCHNDAVGKVVRDDGSVMDMRIDIKRYEGSVHGDFTCGTCHMAYDRNPHTRPGGDVPEYLKETVDDVRAKARLDSVALASCSGCHTEIYEKVARSVHGEGVIEKGSPDSAFCIDCHGPAHYIVPSALSTSPASRVNITSTCASCHADKALVERNGLAEGVVESFNDSFHGKKLLFGHDTVPTCIQCHDYHAITRADDANSPVFGSNKKETCGKCHPGANDVFVSAITHQDPGPIPHYAEIALILLTMGTIAFVVLHFVLEGLSDIRDTFIRKPEKEEEDNVESDKQAC